MRVKPRITIGFGALRLVPSTGVPVKLTRPRDFLSTTYIVVNTPR